MTAMREPIEQRCGHPFALEHLRPFGEREVAGDQRAASFVPVGEQLEQQLGPHTVERDVAQFVADQQVEFVELSQQFVELVRLLRSLQLGHQVRRRVELHALSHATCRETKRDRQMCLPGSGLADEAGIEVLVDPLATREFKHLLLRHVRDRREVVRVEIFVQRECRAADPGLQRVRTPCRDFQLGQPQQVLLVVLVAGGCFAGQLFKLRTDRGQPQQLEIGLE